MVFFPHRHLLGIKGLSHQDITLLLDKADEAVKISRQREKKTSTLRGLTQINLFFEASTRTQSSFELAGKRLGADVMNMSVGNSSVKKGETLIDTAMTLNAMRPDVLVVRHSSAGAAALLAQKVACSVVNAGDGQHEHPTQALLDALTIRRAKGELSGITVAICGDVLHSRVARSNIILLNQMGARVRVVAPATLLPSGIRDMSVEVFHDMKEGLKNADVVMMLRLQRLKDKLGNRSNASAEVEFTDAFGYLLGDPGSGIRTILDMVTLTRLDCALASAGMMRASLAEAVHYARGRSVFGKMLVTQPIMTRVLADMALDVAAATALSFRLASAFDAARNNPAEAAYARVMTPIVKYWCCKIAPALIYEAMECLGGNGYVEERPIARHYREAPVNAIWEGSGNVMALDVLRVLQRGKDLFDLVFQTLERDLGPAGKKTTDVLRAAIALAERDEGAARLLVEQFALAAAAAELCRLGAGKIADAFLETRLAGGWRHTYGMLDSRFDPTYIIDLLYPPAA